MVTHSDFNRGQNEWVGTAHRRTASEAVLVGDAHPTNICQGIFEIGSKEV